MRITDFQKLIQQLPDSYQSFDIKRKNWKIISRVDDLNKIFQNSDSITINRFDLINCKQNTTEFILKTLMWGYPTKGRGSNIYNLLGEKSFIQLKEIIENYRNQEISISTLKNDINSVKGLGLSTLTKFTHFLDTRIENKKAVILDLQIIEAINTGRFEEFNSLKGISYANAPNRYLNYIEIVDRLSKSLNTKPDQIEMFLFTFGRILSEPNQNLSNVSI